MFDQRLEFVQTKDVVDENALNAKEAYYLSFWNWTGNRHQQLIYAVTRESYTTL